MPQLKLQSILINNFNNLSMNIKGGASAPTAGTFIDTYTSLDDSHQTWTFEDAAGFPNYFFIQSTLTDPNGQPLVVGISGSNPPSPGTRLDVQNPHSLSDPRIERQLWTWVFFGVDNDKGYLTSMADYPNLVINLKGSGEAPPETPVDVWVPDAGARQVWLPLTL